MKPNKDIENLIADALIGRPYTFVIKDTYLHIYQATLGVKILSQKIINTLGINQTLLKKNSNIEVLRLVHEKKEECLTLISYYTCKNKEEIFNHELLEKRKAHIRDLSDAELASLMIVILSSDKTDIYIHELGIDKEQDKLSQASKIKKSKNNISFGGLSMFGTLLDMACERYGWTKEYVVWGIDYTSLRLMLADRVNDLYFSDEELNKLPASIRNKNGDIIKPTKENMEQIMNMDWR